MASTHSPSGLTILMVENEEVTVCLLEFVLQKNGYRVIHCKDGRQAKHLLVTMDPPDAVLLDMALPDTTGLDLLACLRRHIHWRTIPVVVLTAGIENFDLRQAARLGVNDYILKPVSPTRLATRLNRLLADAHRTQTRVA